MLPIPVKIKNEIDNELQLLLEQSNVDNDDIISFCLGCGIIRMWFFTIWDVWDVGCSRCWMFGIWDVRDVGCLGCGIFGMWDDWDFGVWG